jgi:sugar/nucleoside kinase (ribokinase family)
MGRVFVMGYLSIDRVRAPDGAVQDQPGGAALYAALGARAVGAGAILLAATGEDWPGAWDDAARRCGIDLSQRVRRPGPTRRARLDYAADGTRGSAHHAEAAWWERTVALTPPVPPEPLGADDVLVLCPMPAGDAARALDAAGPARAVADTSEAFARYEPEALRALLPRLFLFAPSREESALLGPLSGCTIVEKRGAEGLVLFAADGAAPCRVTPPAVEVVDPTGAGDATVGAIAGGLAQGQSLEDALRAAVAIGARAVTSRGPAALGFQT